MNANNALSARLSILKWLGITVLLITSLFSFALYSTAGTSTDSQDNSVMSLINYDLVDQNGSRLKRSDLDGKLVLMNFFFTGCGSACPVQTAVLRDVQEGVDPSVDVLFLSVSIAPLADTEIAIDEYIEKYQVSRPNWKFVTASVASTEELIQRFAVTLDNTVVNDDQPDHRNMGYLFGKSGVLMQQYQLVPGMGKRLVREINELFTLEPQT